MNDELNQAVWVHKAGDFIQAETLYRQFLGVNPQDPDALHLLGVVSYQQGRLQEAIDIILQAIGINVSNPLYYNSLGVVLRSVGKYRQSISCYQKAIQLSPRYAEAHYNLGVVFQTKGRLQDAITHYHHAITFNSTYPEALNNLGAALNEKGAYREAAGYCRKALQIKPDFTEAMNNMANALKALGDLDSAIDFYQRAIRLGGDSAELHSNLGNAFCDAGRYGDALKCYNRAIALDASYGKAYNNLGIMLRNQRKLDSARKCFIQAMSLLPADSEAYHNLGNLFYDEGDLKTAAKWYKNALSKNSTSIATILNLGIVCQEDGDLENAVISFKRVLDMDPNNEKACSHLFHAYLQQCDWDACKAFSKQVDTFTQCSLEHGRRPEEMPFLNLIRSADPEVNYGVAKSWSNVTAKSIRCSFHHQRKEKNKITIGYISNNIKNHPTAHLIWSIFNLHCRQRFSVNVYSYGKDDNSIYRDRVQADCDRFVDIRLFSHLDAARQIHADQVDILIDLVGYMRANRMEIAACRPAPIQARWLGLAGTTGADFFDYIITDEVVTPETDAPFYSEKFIYMPHCYQVNSPPMETADRYAARRAVGLPENVFVYCCFCSTYKIDAVVFDLWMDILGGNHESILWIMECPEQAQINMRKRAEKCGIDPDRIIFARKLPKHEHLERLKFADLSLDTLVVSGAATTSDALWARVPVLTVKGTHFASRMTSSILHAIGLDDLVAPNQRDYLKMAVELGTNPSRFDPIKARLKDNCLQKPLFDAQRFVKDLEYAYLKMWEKHLGGERPETIRVLSV